MFRAGFFHAIHPHRLTRLRWRGERYFANGLRGLAWCSYVAVPSRPAPVVVVVPVRDGSRRVSSSKSPRVFR